MFGFHVHRRRTLVMITIASTIGGFAAVAPRLFGDDRARASYYDEQRSVTSLELPGDASSRPGRVASSRPRVPAAVSPVAAATEFLEAEVALNHVRSFDLLTDADRRIYSSHELWRRQHRTMPTLVGFEIGPVEGDLVHATLRYAPTLDEVLGLVAGRSTVTLTAVAEAGGYRIAFTDTVAEPVYADVAGVVPAARRWVEARRDCEVGTWRALEWSGGVLGDGAPLVLEALCDAPDSPVIAVDATPLVDRFGIEPLVAAFGPEVGTWARTVDMSVSDLHVDLVLAPVGESWLVIGAITRTPTGSG